MSVPFSPRCAKSVWIHTCVIPAGMSLPSCYRSQLIGGEHAHYHSLGRQGDRDEFAAARGLARVALMIHSGQHITAIKLATCGLWTKPSAVGCGDWQVNITHCQGAIAVAVAEGIQVGVDVEAGDKRISEADLARVYFAAAEASALAAQPFAQTRSGFYRLWSAKEALAKAAGGGLERMLATDLSPLLSQPRMSVGRWTVECLLAAPDISCAVAAPRPWVLGGMSLWTIAQIAAILS